jgi:HlyD family secretion protein
VSSVEPATTTIPVGAVVSIGSSAASGGSASSGSGSGSASSGSAGSGSTGATPFVPLMVRPSKPLAAALNGENVLVTVETGKTEGPVLTVPVAAIVTAASGRSYVTVASGGKQTEVTVTPGISENGYVQVTPAKPGALTASDNVVVSG